MKLRNPMNKWGMWRHDISFSEKFFWSIISIAVAILLGSYFSGLL